MTHSPDFGAENRCLLLDCVSYRSGTRFFWYQIPAPIGCVFYFVPISGRIHVITTATGGIDWSMPLFSFCLYSLVILLFVVNFLRRPCWFSAPIFRTRYYHMMAYRVAKTPRTLSEVDARFCTVTNLRLTSAELLVLWIHITGFASWRRPSVQ